MRPLLRRTEVTRYVKRADKKVNKRLAAAVAARQASEDGDELFHRARKAGKRHRYAVEATIPLWGSKAEKIVAARKDLQDVLGHHQDRIVQAEFLRDLGARLGVRSGQNGFTYGVLYGEVVAEGKTLIADLEPLSLGPRSRRRSGPASSLRTRPRRPHPAVSPSISAQGAAFRDARSVATGSSRAIAAE